MTRRESQKKKRKLARRKLARIMRRPSAYHKIYDQQARKMCLLGYTDDDLAKFFEVSVSTINDWKNRHPSFLESIKAGKEIPDAEVAASLLHRAMGYSHKAVKIMQTDGVSFEHEYVEHYPPDTHAGIFWLKNRQPARWRDTQRTEVTGKDGGAIEVKHTPEDIAAAAVIAKQLQNANQT